VRTKKWLLHTEEIKRLVGKVEQKGYTLVPLNLHWKEGKVQLTDGYVLIRDGELFLLGCQINPLKTASTHVNPDAIRTKKLLLKKNDIEHLIIKVEQKGYTLVPLNLHWKNGFVKCEIALAKGKAEHDKRDTIKDREGKREVERAMKSRNR
jgi:SsrA-binding protein